MVGALFAEFAGDKAVNALEQILHHAVWHLGVMIKIYIGTLAQDMTGSRSRQLSGSARHRERPDPVAKRHHNTFFILQRKHAVLTGGACPQVSFAGSDRISVFPLLHHKTRYTMFLYS